jgi:hypothetical protein
MIQSLLVSGLASAVHHVIVFTVDVCECKIEGVSEDISCITQNVRNVGQSRS